MKTKYCDKKALVVCHLFHEYAVDDILRYIKNFTRRVSNYDIVFTLSADNAAIKNKISRKLGHCMDNIKIKIICDRAGGFGADVWPFLCVINETDLSQYGAVFKIHTKRNPTNHAKMPKKAGMCFYVGGAMWRKFMISAIMGRGRAPHVVRELSASDGKTGMVSFGPLTVPRKITDDIIEIADRCEIGDWRPDTYRVCYGTMFAIRAQLLEPIKGIFTADDFITGQNNGRFAFLAYTFEIFFGYLVAAAKMEYKNLNPWANKRIMEKLSRRRTFWLYRIYAWMFLY